MSVSRHETPRRDGRRAAELARVLSQAEQAQIVIVGAEDRTWIHSSTINWVTVALLNRRHPDLFEGFSAEQDPRHEYFHLAPFGREVMLAIKKAQA